MLTGRPCHTARCAAAIFNFIFLRFDFACSLSLLVLWAARCKSIIIIIIGMHAVRGLLLLLGVPFYRALLYYVLCA